MSDALITGHARARMQQRGIRAEALEALLDFGRSSRGPGGCDIVFLDRKARQAKKKSLPAAYAVIGADGAVVTVGHRYRRIPRR